MEHNPVGWFEIYVQDVERAKKFYESVFQVKLDRIGSPNIEMWGFPMVSGGTGCSGALVHMPGFPAGGNCVLVYFVCEDCAVEGARVLAAGGRLQREKMSIGPHGFIVLAIDTEGNMFGLHSKR